MKVFISWSGERSRKIGDAFKRWLPDVMQFVKPYFTPDDIEKGQRWSTEIAVNLEASKFGLFCVTEENRFAPWLMFEAGAISKSRSESRVCVLLCGLDTSQLSGPLQEFQATTFSKGEVFKFVQAVNSAGGELALLESQLQRLFDRFWPDLETEVNAVLASVSPEEKPPKRGIQDMVEETLAAVRSLTEKKDSPEGVQHWVVLYDMLLVYMRESLRIVGSAENAVAADLLVALKNFSRSMGNLINPKLTHAKSQRRLYSETTDLAKEIEIKIAAIRLAVGEDNDEIPF